MTNTVLKTIETPTVLVDSVYEINGKEYIVYWNSLLDFYNDTNRLERQYAFEAAQRESKDRKKALHVKKVGKRESIYLLEK